MVLVVKFEGKLEGHCMVVQMLKDKQKFDNYPVNMLRVNCIDGKKQFRLKII